MFLQGKGVLPAVDVRGVSTVCLNDCEYNDAVAFPNYETSEDIDEVSAGYLVISGLNRLGLLKIALNARNLDYNRGAWYCQ